MQAISSADEPLVAQADANPKNGEHLCKWGFPKITGVSCVSRRHNFRSTLFRSPQHALAVEFTDLIKLVSAALSFSMDRKTFPRFAVL